MSLAVFPMWRSQHEGVRPLVLFSRCSHSRKVLWLSYQVQLKLVVPVTGEAYRLQRLLSVDYNQSQLRLKGPRSGANSVVVLGQGTQGGHRMRVQDLCCQTQRLIRRRLIKVSHKVYSVNAVLRKAPQHYFSLGQTFCSLSVCAKTGRIPQI